MPDSVITSHTEPYFIHISAYFFAVVCDFVHESDFHSKERIGCIFSQFRRFFIHENDGNSRISEWLVDLGNDIFSLVRTRTYYDSGRIHRVFYCESFAEKFWIRNHIKRNFCFCRNGLSYSVCCAYWNG